MRFKATLLVCGLVGFGFGCGTTSKKKTGKKLEPGVAWQVTSGVQTPESAYHDRKSGYLFVSQIGGGGAKAVDNDGWITKMTTDGKVVKSKWATGLSAPKGMRSFGGTLWVTDINRIVSFDIRTGKMQREVPVKGAKFLNDLAIDRHGTVYFSDMFTSTIYRYKFGKVDVLDSGEKLKHPNGLLVKGDELIVAAWGPGIQEDFSTTGPGPLMAINLKNGKRRQITSKGIGHLDGVESDGRGGYIVSDWMAGKIYHISAKGKVRTVAKRDKGTADLAYLPKKRLIIVPEMLKNRITALEMK
ncbi:MAG: SMP-30/gluconolactonase/LRE family protein [Phycisphaeraceae bacterium]|nr:SMP-30/gluconolactonase/LRE family protein [Phycisphaeraceae bacterium]